MRGANSLKIIGDDIYYLGAKVASIVDDKGISTILDKFKREIKDNFSTTVEYCRNCRE